VLCVRNNGENKKNNNNNNIHFNVYL
jgi:hypothetical protein